MLNLLKVLEKLMCEMLFPKNVNSISFYFSSKLKVKK